MKLKCPNCQIGFKKGVVCPHCNIDTHLYKGAMRVSVNLHNKGLERLKNGDFFHGIDILSKSIVINKRNVPARNLLGLALFEIGHVGEALKHWVISRSLQKDNNPAEKYIESIHKNARQLEKLNDAVEMYNQALGHIKQKSDDLAIIQLKKALEINPRFVDALNLLTLCYLIQNDRERANSTLERVLSIDASNPVSLNYYSIINPGKKAPKPAAKPKTQAASTKGPYKAIGIEEKKQRNFHFAELFTFLIGVGCTIAACYFLLVPALERSHQEEMEESGVELAATSEYYQQRLNQANSEKQEVQYNLDRVSAELQSTEIDLLFQERINEINLAYFLYLDDELLRAVDAIENIDVSDLPHNIVERRETVLNDSFPRLAMEFYNAGNTSFNGNDNFMALQHFENAHRFLNREDFPQEWDRTVFMLGYLLIDDEQRSDEAPAFIFELRDAAGPDFTNLTGTQRTRMREMLARLE